MTVQRWRKRATGVTFLFWVVAALLTGSRWSDNGLVTLIFFAVGCILMGIGVLGRVWCLVCIAGMKNDELITDGPYSLCRNPLYLFSLIGTVGVGLGSCTISLPAIAAVGFAVWYPGVIAFEQRNLLQRHGSAYQAYRQRTPALLPRCLNFHESDEHTVRSSSFRRGVFDTIWFFAFFAMLHIFCELHRSGSLPEFLKLP